MAVVAHGRYLGAVEYITETTYGTTPTGPAMQWVGYVQSFRNTGKVLSEDIKYLKDNSYTTGRPDSHKNVQTGEDVSFEIEYIPQVGRFWQAGATANPTLFTGAFTTDTTPDYTPTDTLPSFSVVAIDKNTDTGKEFNVYTGCLVQDMTLSVEVGTAMRCRATCLGNALTPTTTDFIGAGSHASEDSAAGLGASHVSDVQMRATGGSFGSIADYVNGLEVKISNKINLAKDLNSTASSKVAAAVLTSREITVSLDVAWLDLALVEANHRRFSLDDLQAFTSYDIACKIENGTTDYYLRLVGARFPEIPFEYSLEDLCGDKITSLPLEGSSSLPAISGIASLA